MTKGVNKKFPSLTDPKFGKPVRVLVWINGEFDIEYDVKLDSSDLRTWAGVLNFLTIALKPRFGAIRKLYHLSTRKLVTCLADIRHGERYVAVGGERFRFKKTGYHTSKEKQKIRSMSKNSFDENTPSMLDFMEYTKKKKRTVIYVMVSGRTCQDPLKVVLTRDDLKAYNRVLKFLGNQLDIEEGVQYLANVKGRIVFRPEELRHGKLYVAVPFNGRFVGLDYIQLFGILRPDKIIRLRKPKTNRSALLAKNKLKTQAKIFPKALVLKSQSDNQIHTATSESSRPVQTEIEKFLPTIKSHSDNHIHHSTSQSKTEVETGQNISHLSQPDGTFSKHSHRNYDTNNRSVEKSLLTIKSHNDNQIDNSASKFHSAFQTNRDISHLSQHDGTFSNQSYRNDDTDNKSVEKSILTIKSQNDNQLDNSISKFQSAFQTDRNTSHLSQQDGAFSKDSYRNDDTDNKSIEQSLVTIISNDDNQMRNSISKFQSVFQTDQNISHLSQQDDTFSKDSHRNDNTDSRPVEESFSPIRSHNQNATNVSHLSQKDGTIGTDSKHSSRKDSFDSQSSKKDSPDNQSLKSGGSDDQSPKRKGSANQCPKKICSQQDKIALDAVRDVSHSSQKNGTIGTVSQHSSRKDSSDSQTSKKDGSNNQSLKSGGCDDQSPKRKCSANQKIVRDGSHSSQKDGNIGTVSKQSLRKDSSDSRSSKKDDPDNQSLKSGGSDDQSPKRKCSANQKIAHETVRHVSHSSQKDGTIGTVSKQSLRKDSSDSRSSKKDGPDQSFKRGGSNDQSPKRKYSANQKIDQTHLQKHHDEGSTNRLVAGIVQSLLSHATEHKDQRKSASSHVKKTSISLSDKVFFPNDAEKKIITSHPDMVIYPGNNSKAAVMTTFAEIAQNKKLEKMANTSVVVHDRDSVTSSEEKAYEESDQRSSHIGSIPKHSILKIKSIVNSPTFGTKSDLVTDKDKESVNLNTTKICDSLNKIPFTSQTTQDINNVTSLQVSQADGLAATSLNSTATQKNLEDSGDNDKSIQTFEDSLSKGSKSQQAASNISKNERSGSNVQNLQKSTSNSKEIYYAPARLLSNICEKHECDSEIINLNIDDRSNESCCCCNSTTEQEMDIFNNDEQQICDCCYAVSDGDFSADEIRSTNQKELPNNNNNKSRSQTLTRNISPPEKNNGKYINSNQSLEKSSNSKSVNNSSPQDIVRNNSKRFNSNINELTKDSNKNDVRRNSSKYQNSNTNETTKSKNKLINNSNGLDVTSNNNKHVNDTGQDNNMRQSDSKRINNHIVSQSQELIESGKEITENYGGGGINTNELETGCSQKKHMGREILKLEILQELRDTLDNEIRRKTDLTCLSGTQNLNRRSNQCTNRCLRENYDSFACSDIYIKRFCGGE